MSANTQQLVKSLPRLPDSVGLLVANAALEKAIAENDSKTEKWIRTAITKGYEGVGIIPYLKKNNLLLFILGINKKNETEYPGGKVEESDTDLIHTVQREVLEETNLTIDRSRFEDPDLGLDLGRGPLEITGGTTGYPSYVFLVEFTEDEFLKMYSKDGTFSKFILTKNIINTEIIVDDISGTEYPFRKHNRKYVIPQIQDKLQELVDISNKDV
jgi:8-oxo-dGTP pyrophosphatase MutT (NUDIX family)